MAFGSKASRSTFGVIALALTVSAAEQTVEVRHDHLRPRSEGAGTLTFGESGLSYRETGKNADKHHWTLPWNDVQQVWISPSEIRVLSYADTWWKLGADREFRLKAAPEQKLESLYSDLKQKLGEKVTAAFAAESADVLWEVPVKLRKGFGGSEGILQFHATRVSYRSKEKGESRTWSLTDIENVSSSGPFDLTITTFERSKLDYGDRRAFNFQLKQRIDKHEYQTLWRRLNQSKQLDYITSIQEKRDR